jgi:hypothetical protein
MRASRTITLFIERPVAEVSAFLADPLNYPKWAAVTEPTFQHKGGLVWRAETPMGPRLIEFLPPNPFGVVDHATYREGEDPIFMPMRVVANEEGTELIYTFFQRPGMSEEQLDSTIEWIRTDLMTLKSLLESAGS